jgi:hypothetical protein
MKTLNQTLRTLIATRRTLPAEEKELRSKIMKNRYWQSFYALVIASAMTLMMAATGLAQNATVRGQVVDEVGAVIPNAELTLTGKDGKERKAKSSATGEFSIAGVPAGTYSLTSTYPGFQLFTANELKVPLDKPLTVTMLVAAVNVVKEVRSRSTAF